MFGRKLGLALVQPELLASDLEPPADHPGIGAGAGLAQAPGRIVVFAAAHLADQLEDVAMAVGIPAADNWRSVSSRREGVAARGSMVRASLASSVVTESATLARLRSAMRERMSMSRNTSAHLVTMPTGWPARSSTSRMRRMIW